MIGIDARPLQYATDKWRGAGTYVYNLAKHLLKLSGGHDYAFILSNRCIKVSNLKQLMNLINRSKVEYKNRYSRFIDKQIILPFTLFRRHFDTVHFTNHLHVSNLKLCKTVITVHDLIQLRYPHAYLRAGFAKADLGFRLALNAIRKADYIITVSEASKKDIVDFIGIRDEKIKVIYEGVDTSIYKSDLNGSIIQDMKDRFSLRRKFVLFVGGIADYKKNIITLLKAFKLLLDNMTNDFDLVLAGEYERVDAIEEIITSRSMRQNVIFLGRLKQNDIVSLYNSAELFVFPSLAEGFGLPVLESMACGTPVVTSNTSSLAEVAGDAAVLIDPKNSAELASAIFELLKNNRIKKELIEKGFKRIKSFSWEKTARETLEVYNKIL